MNNFPRAAAELLRFQKVAAGYGRHQVLRELNFTISRGDYVAFVGTNGSGKTTLLRTLLGLLKPLSGRITTSTAEPLHYGYVPQLQTVDEIFPLTAHQVVLMGRYGRLGALRRPGTVDREKATAALNEVGIAELADQLYRNLSGGQKQRALIARALAADPDILVLDEHTSDLDVAAEKSIMALIDGLHSQHQLAVVMVSHSLNTVANHAGRIGLIGNGLLQLEDVDTVMQTPYLQTLYGTAIRVIEVDGVKLVI